jgi:hypothetical protein
MWRRITRQLEAATVSPVLRLKPSLEASSSRKRDWESRIDAEGYARARFDPETGL